MRFRRGGKRGKEEKREEKSEEETLFGDGRSAKEGKDDGEVAGLFVALLIRSPCQ